MQENLRAKKVRMADLIRDVPLGQVVREYLGPVGDTFVGRDDKPNKKEPDSGLRVKKIRI